MAPPGETLEQFKRRRITYYPFPHLEQDLISGLKEFSNNLKIILTGNKIDLIHIHGAPELMFLVRRIDRKTPLLFTIHGFHGELKGWDYWLCARLCNKYATKVIAVAKAEEKILLAKGIRPELIGTVLNGVPDPSRNKYEVPEVLRRIKTSKIIIGAIARLETTKGINFLLEAFANIYPNYQNIYLNGERNKSNL